MNLNTLTTGKPKICIPIMGKDSFELKHCITQCKKQAGDCMDLAELRLDYLEHLTDPENLKTILREVKTDLGNIPLLCTLRTRQEGGEQEVSCDTYEDILSGCILSGCIDLIDIELSKGNDLLKRLSGLAKKQGVSVIASMHNFKETPSGEEMYEALTHMEEYADIAKIAVMPNTEEDVLTLLTVSARAKKELSIPFITISMGKLGAVSRICGETFGSCITFGAGTDASAPGQIPATQLRKILELL